VEKSDLAVTAMESATSVVSAMKGGGSHVSAMESSDSVASAMATESSLSAIGSSYADQYRRALDLYVCVTSSIFPGNENSLFCRPSVVDIKKFE